MQKYQLKFHPKNAKIGPLYLVACEEGLCGVFFEKQPIPLIVLDEEKKLVVVQILKTAVQQLDEYFLGQRKQFDLTLKIEGTAFQKKVWAALQRISYGKTHSYAQIASQIRNPRAVRAVGSANGANPLAIIIPCHRVIAKSGKLGGYGGGLSRKSALLKLEHATQRTSY